MAPAIQRVELVGRREGVAVRQRSLESQHVVAPRGEWGSGLAGGDSLVAHRGVVGPGSDMWPDSRPAWSSIPSDPATRSTFPPDPNRASRPDGWAPGATMERGAAPGARHDPRHPGLVPVQGRRRPGHLRREGEEPAQPASNYFAHRARSRRGPARWSTPPTSVEWIEVRNEVEALFLEYNLIKKHRPRFNIRLKDDKSYPYLAVTLDEEWPRAMVMRGAKRKGVRYFGPYAHAYAIRETLDLLLRTFPIRTCTNAKFDRHQRLGRPCLYAHIEKCVGAVRRRRRPTTSTTELVDELLAFLDGEHRAGARPARASRCTRPPTSSSSSGRRGSATSSPRCARRSSASRWSAPKEEDFDVIGIAEDALEASVQVFFVRKGRVVGRKGLVVDKVEDVDAPGARRRASLEQLYGDARGRRRATRGPRPGRAGGPRALRGVPRRSTRGQQGAHPGPAARRRSASCSRRSTHNARRGVRPAQAEARVRPQRARRAR